MPATFKTYLCWEYPEFIGRDVQHPQVVTLAQTLKQTLCEKYISGSTSRVADMLLTVH